MEFSSFDTLAMVVISIVFNWVTIANGINASISLHVEGLGFHRTFKYRVDVNEVSTETSCIALYFELPSALYVDPDELAGLLRLGKLIGCSQGETNVELFTEKAGPQNLTICSPISDMSSSTTFLLPIHRRYQFAKLNGTYAQIFLQRPRLFIGSVNKNEEHRVSVVNLCSPCTSISHKWLEIFYEFSMEDYLWDVPIGNLSQTIQVTYVTLLVTIIGTAFVLRTIMQFSGFTFQWK